MPGLDTGNTGFMLLCTSLVMLMTPGLAFFYGGLVGRKNVLAIMMQSFVSMGWTTVLWFAVGYSLCFSRRHRRHHRQPRHGVPQRRHARHARRRSTPTIPMIVFIAYQMMFAIITPALITGRVRQPGHVQGLHALPDRLAAVRLLPVRPHDLGRRAARRSGACSTSPAASSSTTSPAWRRSRRSSTSAGGAVADSGPHSIPLVALGTGLLWFGWYGFNAGSEFRVDSVTAVAFLNTDVAASFAAIAWLAIDWCVEKQAEVPRPADRRGRRPGDDHAGGRLRLAGRRRCIIGIVAGRRLLRRGRAQEPAQAGTTRSTSGASTASAASSASSCSACSRRRPSTRPAPTACSPATRRSSSKQVAAVVLVVGLGVRASPTGCSG